MSNLDQSVQLYEQFVLGWWAWGTSSFITPAPEMVPSALAMLEPVYPNPFNPATTIPVLLTKDTHVQLNVNDMRGLLVKSLQDGDLSAGKHLFTFKGKNLASGVYFCRMKTSAGVQTRPMTMVK